MSKETGGPAFPLQSIGPDFPPGYSGMTLRDYFAAKALSGMLADPAVGTSHKSPQEGAAALANVCYMLADAMLAERAKC